MASEAAVAEPPVITETQPAAAVTPVEEVYEKALAEAKGEKAKETKPKTTTKAAKETPDKPVEAPKEAKPSKTAAKEEKPATDKPATAIEAALEAPKPAEETEKGAEENPLAQFEGKDKNWDKAKETIDQLHKERLRLKGELEKSAKPDPKIIEQIANLTKERDDAKRAADEMKDAIVAVNIELEPTFRKEFVDGRAMLVNRAVDKLKAYGGNSDLLKNALALPEGKLRDDAVNSAMGEIEDGPRSKINLAIAEIDKLDERKAEQMANPQQSWERLQQSQQAARAKETEAAEAQKKTVWEATMKKVAETHPTLRIVTGDVEGAKDWNDSITASFENALKLHSNGVTPETTMEIAAKGSRFDFVENLLVETRNELKAARKQLSEYETSQPDIKGHSKPKSKEVSDPGQLYYETLTKLKGGGEEA